MDQIKTIFYKEITNPYSNNQYGLVIIIMMQKNGCISIHQIFVLLSLHVNALSIDYQLIGY